MTAEIYKWSLADCSNHGLSSTAKEVNIVPEKTELQDAPENAVYIVGRKLNGEMYYHLVPLYLRDSKQNIMAGGSWVYSCDSRFPFVGGFPHINHPIALHDRVEAW